MLIKSKFEGYSKDGIRLYPCDGGGGGGQPTQTTQTSDLPDWAKGFAKDVLGKGEALTGSRYQTYGGERQAQFTPLQQQAFQGAANMGPSAATGQGIDFASQAAQRALNTGYNAGQFQNQFQAPGQYQAGQFNPQQVSADSFTRAGAAQNYMSPYMQNVVDIQQREAQRTADIASTQRGAQAVSKGAFGGSRQAIMDAEAARNLAQQKGDIQATGQQAAFQNAQQQFNAEQNARMQAQLANQQYGMTAQQLAEQSRQFGAGQGLTAAQLQAQFGQSAQQLGEQSRQYGAGLGLQGLQAALTGAGQLGSLGNQQFSQGMDANLRQQQFGTQQQQQVQSILGNQYQDFLNQQRAPYQQLEFMSNLLRGTPSGSTQQLYTAAPSTAAQLLGAGTALGGAYLMGGRKEGGVVGKYAKGGKVKKAAGLGELALSKI
jgi:hypothetical protein